MLTLRRYVADAAAVIVDAYAVAITTPLPPLLRWLPCLLTARFRAPMFSLLIDDRVGHA